MANKKNYSDELFEKYLFSQNLSFEYEKEESLRAKIGKQTPDYVVYDNSQEIWLDVKQFDPKEIASGHIYSSTIKNELDPIRNKITHTKDQLKDFKDFPCGLVLYGFDPFTKDTLRTPFMIYGAMYGDVGWSYPSKIPVFTSNGKMFHRKSSKVWNTTFSCLIVLREIVNNQVGVIVYENFYARIPLPKDIFCGDYDIRYGKDGNKIKRLFAGQEILKNEYLNEDSNFVINFEN